MLPHTSVKASATMPISIMGKSERYNADIALWVVIVCYSLIKVNSVSGKKSIIHALVLLRSLMMKCL